MKRKVAKEIAKRVQDTQIIGMGTGSTVDMAIEEIANIVHEKKLNVVFLSSSMHSTQKAESLGLLVLSNDSKMICDWGFDGADSVDPSNRVIKGRGGALLGEKILATKCKHYIVIVDETKLVDDLAKGALVPIEFFPEARNHVYASLLALGASEINERNSQALDGTTRTEKGHTLVDVRFKSIDDSLEKEIKSITGIVDSGLFLTQVDEVWVGSSEGVEKRA